MPEFDHVNSALIFTQGKVGLRGRDAEGWVHRGDVSYEDPAITERLQALVADAGPVTLVLPEEQVLYLDLPEVTDADAARAEAAARTPYPAEDLVFDVHPHEGGYRAAVVARRTLDEARSFAEHHDVAFNAIAADGTKAKFGAVAWFWKSTPDPFAAAGEDDPIAEPTAVVAAQHDAPEADLARDNPPPEIPVPPPVSGPGPLTASKAAPDSVGPRKTPSVNATPRAAVKAPVIAAASEPAPAPSLSPSTTAGATPHVVRHTDRPSLTPRSRAVQERAAMSRDNPGAAPARNPRKPVHKSRALSYMVVALALAILLALWLFPTAEPDGVIAPQTPEQTAEAPPPSVPATAAPTLGDAAPDRVTRITVPIGTPAADVAAGVAAPQTRVAADTPPDTPTDATDAPVLAEIPAEAPQVVTEIEAPVEEAVEVPAIEAPEASAPTRPALERSPRPRNRPARRAPTAVLPANTTSVPPRAANRPATLEAVPATPADPVPYDRARIESLADDRPAARPAAALPAAAAARPASPTAAPAPAPQRAPEPSTSPPPRPAATQTDRPEAAAPAPPPAPTASPRPRQRPSAQLERGPTPGARLARAQTYAPGLAMLIAPGEGAAHGLATPAQTFATVWQASGEPLPRTAMLGMRRVSNDAGAGTEGPARLYRAQARPSQRPEAGSAPSGVDNSVDAAIGAALGRSGRPAARAAPTSSPAPSEAEPAAAQNATGGLLHSARPIRRAGANPSSAGNPSTVGLGADVSSQAVEDAIAAAVSSSTATPGAVPLTALRSSTTPPRRQAAPAATQAATQAPAVVTPDPEAERAAARATQLRLDEELQAQAEARARAQAAADARREAQARAAAEARARAKALAEEKAAQASTYRPVEVDNEPELGAVKIPATAGRAAGSATAKGAMDIKKTQLIGVIGAGKASRGLIRLRNGKIVTVRLGDKIDGGVIDYIGKGHVRYVKRGRAYQLKILNGR